MCRTHSRESHRPAGAVSRPAAVYHLNRPAVPALWRSTNPQAWPDPPPLLPAAFSTGFETPTDYHTDVAPHRSCAGQGGEERFQFDGPDGLPDDQREVAIGGLLVRHCLRLAFPLPSLLRQCPFLAVLRSGHLPAGGSATSAAASRPRRRPQVSDHGPCRKYELSSNRVALITSGLWFNQVPAHGRRPGRRSGSSSP